MRSIFLFLPTQKIVSLQIHSRFHRIPKEDKVLLRMIEDNSTKLDPSTQMNPALYCSFVEAMKKECYTKSLLELWNFKEKQINSLTKEDIIRKINTYDKK